MNWTTGWPTATEVQKHADRYGRNGAGPWLVRNDHGRLYVIVLSADSGEVEYTFGQDEDSDEGWHAPADYREAEAFCPITEKNWLRDLRSPGV